MKKKGLTAGEGEVLIKLISSYFNIFGDDTKKKMLLYLGDHPDSTIKDLKEHTNKTFKNTEFNVNHLIEIRLITKEKEGKYTKINLTPEGKTLVETIKLYGSKVKKIAKVGSKLQH